MSSEKKGENGGLCLSSCTYLNARVARELSSRTKGKGLGGEKEFYRTVPVVALKAELLYVAEQMSYAPYDEYGYLKGQYVALYRILKPELSEAAAQIIASNCTRTWGNDERGPLRTAGNKKPMDDNEYLAFCGIGLLRPEWQLKHRGVVEHGDTIWCSVCDEWIEASGDEIGRRTSEIWTAECVEKGGKE